MTGLMLLFGVLDSANFNNAVFTSRVHDDWWWYLLFLVLASAVALLQSRQATARDNTRTSWS